MSGLFEKNLDAMKPADAEAMLVRIAPRLAQAGNECIADLALLCGYLPLALRTAASTLQIRRNLKPAAYVNRLRDTANRLKELDEVQVSLQVSYELLPEDMQQKFRFLAVFPDTFDAPAAAAILEVEHDLAEDILEKLLLYSLVDFDEATSRYREHDLVRLFADRHLVAEERETSRRRHARHYLNVLKAANDLYKKGGDSVLKGLALFDTEWGNIEAGQAWAAASAHSDDTAARCCSNYSVAGVHCLSLRQHPRDRIVWLEIALQAARQLKDRHGECAIFGNLGLAYSDLGEYRRAIEYHEEDLRIARETGNQRGEGKALGNLGLAYQTLGEYSRAIEHQDQRLKIVREIGDRVGEGQALGNLGVAYEGLEEYRRAIEYHEQALIIDREIGDRRGEGQDLGNLGIVYDALEDYNTAIEYYEQRLQIAREIGDRLGEANGLFNSSLTLNKLGDRAKATNRAEAALEIYEAIESPTAKEVRNQLAKWREEEKTKGQAAE